MPPLPGSAVLLRLLFVIEFAELRRIEPSAFSGSVRSSLKRRLLSPRILRHRSGEFSQLIRIAGQSHIAAGDRLFSAQELLQILRRIVEHAHLRQLLDGLRQFFGLRRGWRRSRLRRRGIARETLLRPVHGIFLLTEAGSDLLSEGIRSFPGGSVHAIECVLADALDFFFKFLLFFGGQQFCCFSSSTAVLRSATMSLARTAVFGPVSIRCGTRSVTRRKIAQANTGPSLRHG